MTYTVATNTVRVAGVLCTSAVVVATVFVASHSASEWEAAFTIETGALALLILFWLLWRLHNWVEHRFERDAHDAERILSDMGRAIAGVRDTRALLAIVVRHLSTCLHTEPIAILLDKGGRMELACCSQPTEGSLALEKSSGTLRHLHLLQGPAKLDFADPQSWVNGLPEAEKQILSKLQARVLTPMQVDRRVVGLLSAGPKRWDMPYSRADLQLLMAAASQTALAIDNARLSDDIRAEIASRERLNRELEIAREVQQRLFPQSLPRVQGLDFAGYCRPAQGVGGDYYDFIRLDNGTLGIAVGDVSGKGIAAALMMASLQASLRGQTIMAAGTLAEMIERINRLVYEASAVNRYATFFYAQYEPDSRQLRYVNAGHNPPILLRDAEIIRLDEGGTVLGLFPQAEYREQTVQLRGGDVMLAFTDGITEALNLTEAEYGEESLIGCARRNEYHSAADLIASVLKDVDAFATGADQHDDMTLVAMRVQ